MGIHIRAENVVIGGQAATFIPPPADSIVRPPQWREYREMPQSEFSGKESELGGWWAARRARWPVLAPVAEAFVGFPVTSVEPERAFSRLKAVLDPHALNMRDVVLNTRLSLMINGELTEPAARCGRKEVTAEPVWGVSLGKGGAQPTQPLLIARGML